MKRSSVRYSSVPYFSRRAFATMAPSSKAVLTFFVFHGQKLFDGIHTTSTLKELNGEVFSHFFPKKKEKKDPTQQAAIEVLS